MDIICSNKTFFKNPNKLPLNELYLDYQKVTRVIKNDHTLEDTEEMLKSSNGSNGYYRTENIKRPALDKCWIDHKKYGSYHEYDLHATEKQNKIFMKNKVFVDDLQFLNNCSFHQFWCYICYEPNVTYVIKEFLHNALPLHFFSHLSSLVVSLHVDAHSCIYKIYERLLKFKESEDEYMREDVARTIIQEKGLLSLDIILMLCYLYYDKPQFISKLMNFCLKKKDVFLRRVNEMLKKIVDELDHFMQVSFRNQKIASVIEERLFFLFEVISSSHHFLSSCKPAVDVAFDVELPYCITHVYQNIFVAIEDIVDSESNKSDWSTCRELINKLLPIAKFEFINLFHVFTTYCLDGIVNLENNSSKKDEYVELYIGLISNALDNDTFVLAYDKTYPIREQFETLMDCVPNFDVQQSEYLLRNLNTIIGEFSNDTEPKIVQPKTLETALDMNKYDSIIETLTQYLDKPANKKLANLPKNVSLALEQYYELTKQVDNHNQFGQDYNKPSKDEIDSSAQAVLDVLPHLDRGFVLDCLGKMNYDAHEVITKVLSNDLSNEVCIASTSKKGKYSNANEMLNDKKEKESIKNFVLKASYVIDLDDEYDDRTEIGNNMDDSEAEARIYRHLEDRNKNDDGDDESSSSGEDEVPGEVRRDTRLDFCTDPALMREKRAQKYQNSTRRVIPNKKSQQSDDKPHISKSTRPKHNRKGGAHWKRNKGMIPS